MPTYIRQKFTSHSLWVHLVSPIPYILLSNPICLLSNPSGSYATSLFSQSSYLFCLLSTAHCSEVTCLLPAFSPLLPYVSPFFDFITSAAKLIIIWQQQQLQHLFTVEFTAVMASWVSGTY